MDDRETAARDADAIANGGFTGLEANRSSGCRIRLNGQAQTSRQRLNGCNGALSFDETCEHALGFFEATMG
jgi:hypothetical protein